MCWTQRAGVREFRAQGGCRCYSAGLLSEARVSSTSTRARATVAVSSSAVPPGAPSRPPTRRAEAGRRPRQPLGHSQCALLVEAPAPVVGEQRLYQHADGPGQAQRDVQRVCPRRAFRRGADQKLRLPGSRRQRLPQRLRVRRGLPPKVRQLSGRVGQYLPECHLARIAGRPESKWMPRLHTHLVPALAAVRPHLLDPVQIPQDPVHRDTVDPQPRTTVHPRPPAARAGHVRVRAGQRAQRGEIEAAPVVDAEVPVRFRPCSPRARLPPSSTPTTPGTCARRPAMSSMIIRMPEVWQLPIPRASRFRLVSRSGHHRADRSCRRRAGDGDEQRGVAGRDLRPAPPRAGPHLFAVGRSLPKRE